jgi:lactoylglutathione lyase
MQTPADHNAPAVIHALFETHLTVRDLDASCAFYANVLGLELAHRPDERRVAFFWLGARGHSMLGIWETGSAPVAIRSHVAFAISLDAMHTAVDRLRARGVTPRGFSGEPVDEPVVIGWMPAVSLYFNDPDGHSLEYIAMLPDPPQPAFGVVPWSEWGAEDDRPFG